jgi:ABC-type antimicrobial peptide transport system permease subunit
VENISLRKGRYFTKEEYASDENLIVLPSYAKDELIGKTVRLLGKDYTVIGILGENASDEFQVPFKTLDDSCSVSDISLLDDNALDVQSFAKLKKAFAEVLDCDVNFPPVETVDLSEIKFYNSIIFMSVAVAVASAVNLAMLFRYVIKSRNKQTAVFLLCGCTRGKIRRMYTAEIGIISVSIYGVFAAVFNYALLPLLKVFFEYIEVAYNPRVYLTIFGIYIVSIYLFLNIVILRTSKASPVKMLKERGR